MGAGRRLQWLPDSLKPRCHTQLSYKAVMQAAICLSGRQVLGGVPSVVTEMSGMPCPLSLPVIMPTASPALGSWTMLPLPLLLFPLPHPVSLVLILDPEELADHPHPGTHRAAPLQEVT